MVFSYDIAFIILAFIYVIWFYSKKIIFHQYESRCNYNKQARRRRRASRDNFINQEILLEGLTNTRVDESRVSDPSLPSNDVLNDRYSPFKKIYTDRQLLNDVIERTRGDDFDYDYGDVLANQMSRSISDDMDSKLYLKSQKIQQLAKQSNTAAAKSSANTLAAVYKNELDVAETNNPWWLE